MQIHKLPWLSEIEEQKYVNGIDWKRKFHSKNGTKLIETYSYYNSDGALLEKLEDLLSSNGVKFNEPDYKDVFTKVYGNLSNKYFAEFIKLCGTFITLFKSNGYKSDELEGLKYKSKEYQTNYHRNRTALFKIIIKPIIADYQDRLDADNAIDFSDMINTATELVKDGYKVHPYKYVIIDEYQDISMSRYRLVKAILEQTQAHLVCVGDDWQSIYRFAGSDISLFTDFEKYYGHSKIMKIEKTYRNSQQLIDEASKFVLSNPIQLNKKLSSDKTCNKPIEIIYFKNNPEKAIIQAVVNIKCANVLILLLSS